MRKLELHPRCDYRATRPIRSCTATPLPPPLPGLPRSRTHAGSFGPDPRENLNVHAWAACICAPIAGGLGVQSPDRAPGGRPAE